MERRKFVKLGASALLTTPFILGRNQSLFANSTASQIVSVFDANASSLKFRAGDSPNSDGVVEDLIQSFDVDRLRVTSMMDTAIKKMTGISNLGKAWESLFPVGKLNTKTKIAIKLNFSYGDRYASNNWSEVHCPFGPKVALSDAITSGLSQMLEGSFPLENITVFDKLYSTRIRGRFPVMQGYRSIQKNELGITKDTTLGTYAAHWVSFRNPLEMPDDAPSFLAAPDFPEEYKAPQKIMPAVYENDFMINVAIAKDHRAAGITGVMKNTYGCTDNPVGTHGSEWMRDDSPYAGTRLCVPVFYKNIDQQTPCILNIMDALAGVYQGGPLEGMVFQANTLAISKDPVAMDSYLLQMLNKFRRKNGFAPLSPGDGRAEDGHKNASFLNIAHDVHKMGDMSLDRNELIDLTGKPAQYEIPIMDKSQSVVGDVVSSKGKFEVPVFMDDSKRKHIIEAHVEDMKGNTVKSFKSLSTKSNNAALAWDMRSDTKETMKNDLYIWHIKVDDVLHTRTIRAL
jgi:hypothetical protein